MLRTACEERKYPNIKTTQYSQDPGMKSVSDLFEGIKSEGYTNMPDAIRDLVYEITSVSSTISIFQPMDNDLLNKLKESLQDNEKDLLTN